ncbi:MAG TPA: RNA polymerase sigma factor, partial [Candidatus Humimicrobiaceae bacterium]
MKNKDSTINHLDEEISDYPNNTGNMEKTVVSENTAKPLNIEELAADGLDTKDLAAEHPDTIKDQKPKNEIDDKILVANSQQGDKAAFEKLVRLYSKYVYTNAFFILRDSHDAEDVSQEVFVKVFLSIKNFRGLSSFKTWLRKLTINTCID